MVEGEDWTDLHNHCRHSRLEEALRTCVFLRFKSIFKKVLNFFYFKLIFFLVFLDHFNALISKIIFKK